MSNHEQCRFAWRFLGEGKPAQAQEQFAQVLARDPNYAAALRGLGWIEHLAGRDRQAETLLTRALQREGDNAEAHFHLGIVYGALERPEPALRSIRRAIDLDPRNPDYYGALA